MDIYGAKAEAFIRYDGNIEELYAILSRGLKLPDFFIDTHDDPPHDKFGYCRGLGMQLWLEKTERNDGLLYALSMETLSCLNENHLGTMHDLSLWLGRHLASVCGIETCILNENQEIIASFESEELI